MAGKFKKETKFDKFQMQFICLGDFLLWAKSAPRIWVTYLSVFSIPLYKLWSNAATPPNSRVEHFIQACELGNSLIVFSLLSNSI